MDTATGCSRARRGQGRKQRGELGVHERVIKVDDEQTAGCLTADHRVTLERSRPEPGGDVFQGRPLALELSPHKTGRRFFAFQWNDRPAIQELLCYRVG